MITQILININADVDWMRRCWSMVLISLNFFSQLTHEQKTLQNLLTLLVIRRKINQNPGYMKENFMICIESLHIADTGEQENVRYVEQY